jgi:ubiquinone/menaquinone biosynthesis C-methylase UbiE
VAHVAARPLTLCSTTRERSAAVTETIPAITPAEAYEAYFGPAIFNPLTDALLPHAAVRPGERVLDLACGTGIVARRLPALVGDTGRVVGVDINPGMLVVARRQDNGIEWLEGNGTALDLPDAVFDLVVIQQGLQFFPDRGAGAREIRRVLADGGRSVLAVWKGPDHHPLYAALAEAEAPQLVEHGVDVTWEDLVAPCSLGDATALRRLLLDSGFADVALAEATVLARFPDADRFLERLEYAYAAVVPRFAEDPAAFAAYLDAVAGATKDVVASYRQGDEIIVPMHTHIAVART